MGNHLKVSKASLYSIESHNATFENPSEQQQMQENSAVQCRVISTKVERHVEMRLEVALKHKFPERWKCFCFGSILNMKGRYRGMDVQITELQKMMGQITKNVQVYHVRPVGAMNFEPMVIRDLKDKALLLYGTQTAKHLSKLRELTISGLFLQNRPVSFDAIKMFFQKISRNLNGLQKLTLNLSHYNNMDFDTMFEMISCELTKGLINLRSIEITMVKQTSQITNESFGSLFFGLNRYSTHLKHLELCCEDYIDDEKIAVIGENLHRNLSNLKSFTLKSQPSYAYHTNLTDKGLEILGSKIGKHLTNLEHLNLSFFCLFSISDTGAEILLSKICENVRNLKSLSLGFSECNRITTSIFIKIFTTVSETQKNLVSLSINFRNHGKVDKSTFKFLRSSELIELSNLRHLKLDFSQSSSIDNDALYMLRDWIRERLPRLKSFFLNILECKRPTRECMITIKRDLSFIPDLEICARIYD